MFCGDKSECKTKFLSHKLRSLHVNLPPVVHALNHNVLDKGKEKPCFMMFY